MKSLAGRLFFAFIWLAMLGIALSQQWDEFVTEHPGASGWDFARSLAPFLGEALAAAACFGLVAALASLTWPRLVKWSSPREDSPPPVDAGPLYAVRTFPVQVAICLLLTGGTIALLFHRPGAAAVTLGLTLAAWVWLGRRLGFGPADTPAAPPNGTRS